jgi:hypothetical protein
LRHGRLREQAGRQTIEIGDVAKVNLNLLVHLINRKFYA